MAADAPREHLRTTFDEDAELYDRVRPGYPPTLFDDLADLAGIGPGARVLEVGPGTGQATADLAARGAAVVAVELGPALAAVARRRLASAAPTVAVVTADFERWPLPAEPFDAIVAFTAWHWLDPAVRTAKAAAALRPGGALATVATTHVAGGTEDFFAEAQACYERWDPATPPGIRLPAADDAAPAVDEVDAGALFGPAAYRRHEAEAAYSTSAYLDLLRSYSGHRAMAPEDLRGLLACVGELIDRRFAGRIAKRYLHELRVARRHDG